MGTIEDYLTLSTSDLKRLGYLPKRGACSGGISWNRGGRIVASIGVQVDTAAETPFIRFVYTANGSPVDFSTPLRFAPSNLQKGGFYYFVCPVTGRSCRKLYLVGSRFVSRFAFRALYEKQTQSSADRGGIYGYLDAVSKLDAITQQPHRKMYYRGQLTPYGRRVHKQAARVRIYGDNLEPAASRSGRTSAPDNATPPVCE